MADCPSIRPATTKSPAPDIQQTARTLELLLPAGHQLVHTLARWHVRKWMSYITTAADQPGWWTVDSDPDLAMLLARLGEPK